MDKEFVPYELALRLKALGFDEPCLAQYKKYDNGEATLDIGFSKNEIISKFDNLILFCSSPTFSQAFRWFREKYDLIYFITPEGSINNRCYLYSIKDWKAFVGTFGQTYEQAELECLKKLIEIVKEN